MSGVTLKQEQYAKKLQDARWQRKRLEVFSRDNFTCQGCGKNEHHSITLNCHHIKYGNGEPWEIDSKHLTTVCNSCHSAMKNKAGSIPVTQILITTLRGVGFEEKDFRDLNKYVWENLTLGDQPWSFKRMKEAGFVVGDPVRDQGNRLTCEEFDKAEDAWAERITNLQDEKDYWQVRTEELQAQCNKLRQELHEKRSTSKEVCTSPPGEPEDVEGI